MRFEILAKEAYRRGYDKDPEVVRTMKQVMIQKLMRDEFDATITADKVKDADMKAYYDANLADFVKPEEVRASAILMKNKAQADRVLLEAKGDAGKTNKGFRDLVQKYSSDEETKLRGGDLRYFDVTDEGPAGAGRQGRVRAGQHRRRLGRGRCAATASFYILKQTGRRKSMTKTFEDAKPVIRNKLFREQRFAAQKDFVDKLRAQAKIEINEANLAKVRIDTSNAVDDGHGQNLAPPPMPIPGVGSNDRPPAARLPSNRFPEPEVELSCASSSSF